MLEKRFKNIYKWKVVPSNHGDKTVLRVVDLKKKRAIMQLNWDYGMFSITYYVVTSDIFM